MEKRKSYTTKTRTEMLSYMKKNWARTITAADVIQHMTEIGSPVSQTTVYRYLDKLCEEHRLVKYPDSTGEKSIYQYTDEHSNCADHLHLKCTVCGRLIHMDCAFLDEFSKHLLEEHNFLLQYKGNMLYGVCKDCLGKAQK